MPGTTRTGGDICERQRAEIAGQVVSGTLSIQEACAQHQLSPELLLEWVATFRQSSLTAFDEQVRRTLADQGVDVSTLASAEFQGDLGEFTIADLIQTLAFGQRDVVLTVSQGGNESRIWCAGGEISDAETGNLTGVAAVFRMLAMEQGRVRASFHRVHRPRKIHASTMGILLDGARRSDECRVLRGRLGSGLYRASAAARTSDVSRSPAETALLELFAAPRAIADALAQSTLGDLETLTLVSQLLEQEWLLAGNEASPSTPAPRPLPVASHPPLVMSLALLATKRPAPRTRTGLLLGLGACGLASWLLPRYLVTSRETELSLPARPAAVVQGGALAAVEPTLAPAAPTATAQDRAPIPASPSSQSTSRPRRRAPRASAAAAASASRAAASSAAASSASRTATAAAAPSPAASAAATSLNGAEPRMQLIEARQPQMQIVE